MSTEMIDLDAFEGREPNPPRQHRDVDDTSVRSELVPIPRRRPVPSLNAICTACGHHQLVTPSGAYPVCSPEVIRKRTAVTGDQPEWACYVFRNCRGCGAKESRFITVSRQAVLDDLHQWASHENNDRDRQRRADRVMLERLRATLLAHGVTMNGPIVPTDDGGRGMQLNCWRTTGAMVVRQVGPLSDAERIDIIRRILKVLDKPRITWDLLSYEPDRPDCADVARFFSAARS